MKICIISSRFYPKLVGSGTIAHSIAKSLTDFGHDVTVITDFGIRKLQEKADTQYPFRVLYIDGLENFAIGSGSPKQVVQQIYTILNENDFDIIQVCNFMPMLLVATIRQLIVQPVVFSPYNTPDFPKRAIGYYSDKKLDMELASFILRTSGYNTLVAGSQNYYDSAIALGASEKSTVLSYLGIDTKELDDRKSTPDALIEKYLGGQINADDTLLMLPSRITVQKGIAEAVKALSIVNRVEPVKLLLTGMTDPFDGQYADRVMQIAKEKGIVGNIVIPRKPIPRSALGTFYKRADIIIVPSHYEGLGLSAIEALALGRPLIAANTKGLNEVAINKYNSLIFDVGDYKSLARLVLRCLNDKALRNKLVENAVKSVEKFTVESHAKELEVVYLSLLQSQHS